MPEIANQAVDGFEPYRRLVELQKQMIELAQQNEKTERECAALRDQVARELAARQQARRSLRHRLRQKAGKVLKRLPGFSARESGLPFNAGNSRPNAAQKVVKAVKH
jgi:hypothetical protein